MTSFTNPEGAGMSLLTERTKDRSSRGAV